MIASIINGMIIYLYRQIGQYNEPIESMQKAILFLSEMHLTAWLRCIQSNL